MFKTSKILAASAAVCLSGAASAASIAPVTAYGHNNRDNFGGNISDIYNGSGMNGYNWEVGDPNGYVDAPASWPAGEGDVSTWEITSGQYRDEWQADQLLDTNTSINGKVGWVIMDLGEVYSVNDMYLWNGIQIGTNALKDFNIYVATNPVVPDDQGPTGGAEADDYNFGVAAWTQIGGLQTLIDGGNPGATDGTYDGTGDGAVDGVYDLGGVAARYVALEMMSRHSGNFNPDTGRIGFAEAGFDVSAVVVPEPASLALIGLGGLMMVGRRRR